MLALVSGHDVAFTLPDEDTRDKSKRFMLNGISVSRNPCNKDCGGWEMVRALDSNVDLTEENFVKFPIQYGVTLPNMQTREYQALEKGRYSAMAGFSVIKNGKIVDSKQVVAGFTIE